MVVHDFEAASKRAEQNERHGPITKIVVELDEKSVSLKAAIESEGIAEVDSDGDSEN